MPFPEGRLYVNPGLCDFKVKILAVMLHCFPCWPCAHPLSPVAHRDLTKKTMERG